jgi:hypothetical protein
MSANWRRNRKKLLEFFVLLFSHTNTHAHTSR